MLNYLRACHSSVRDQEVDFEHIVVDGASTDGTPEWLSNQSDIIGISEKDAGMYDAINKGVRLARGDILAYLNCDEQYLAGSLKRVQEYFRTQPTVDVLFGNTLILRPDGRLLAFRKGFPPRWQYFWGAYMYLNSSSMFIRRRVFEAGYVFDTKWKTIGDLDFIVRLLRNNHSVMHMQEYLSAFIMTGSNLGLGRLVRSELQEYRQVSPWWLRNSGWCISALIRFEKLIRGLYFEKMPLHYSVYPIGESNNRVSFVSAKSTPLFPQNFTSEE